MFRAIYHSDFKDRKWVEEQIERWNAGQSSFMLKTSGTTGKPKEISLSRELLIWSANATKASLHLGQEKVICCIPVQKTGGFMQLIRALHFGWEIYFVSPKSNPFEGEETSEYSFTSFTPMQLDVVLNENPESLVSFKNILVGGAKIGADLLQKIQKWNDSSRNTTIWETYGMTETASHIALKNLTKNEAYFKTQEGVKVNSKEDRLGIEIKELNLNLDTNDLAELHEDGFAILGRRDNVINSGGIKIHPESIEPQIADILESIRIYRPFYLSSIPDKLLGEKLILILEGTPITDAGFILEILKRELPAYTNPKEMFFVKKIETTDTGKLKRKRLSEYS